MSEHLTIVKGTNSKPAASGALVRFFEDATGYEGRLFIGYPIISAPEGPYPIDALLVSPRHGIVVFDLIEGAAPEDFSDRQDYAANMLEAKLKVHRELSRGRKFLPEIFAVSFAPGIPDTDSRKADEYHPICNVENLEDTLKQFHWEPEKTLFESTLSAIQSISTIRKSRTKRSIQKADSRGAKLKHLEDSIATLDRLQSKAVIETVEGVQRIRGLAGSGKTIVLALKAAYLQAQHPDWRIAVTFQTRSLKGQFRRLIRTFAIEQGQEPDWENLRILNAWGASGGSERDGIYHEFCSMNQVPYFDFQNAKRMFGPGNEFGGACEHALKEAPEPMRRYDAILVDEAQDFSAPFLRLCYEFLREPKRLVYAYDELQNLSEASTPPPEEIFGTHPDGTPRVRLSRSSDGEPRTDIILDKCYRNSRPVLTTAHAMGFGIYRDPAAGGKPGLVQMFDHPRLWEEIGYRVKEGELTEGHEVILERTGDTSPKFLEEHSPLDDLIQFRAFDSEEEQTQWLVEAIWKNIQEDELRHDDIVVINPNPWTTREKVGPSRSKLFELGINSHLAGVDTHPDIFFDYDDPSVTFTGIYRAKGNEAGMVYVINGQACNPNTSFNLATIRNRLFTAISRSKAWVRVLGVGPKMAAFVREFQRLRENDFELRFRYPTEEERRRMKTVHRDMTGQEKKRLEERAKSLKGLIEDLEVGRIQPEDLDEGLVQKLNELMNRGAESHA